MHLFGLTGGIGMGKTTAAALLRERGAAVVDTDVIARQLVEAGQPALEEIARVFGPAILAPNGSLDRPALARRVFADEPARQKLEEILHPRIRAAWQDETNAWKQAGKTWGVVVIPLLFETNAAGLFDSTVCVACSPGTQNQRLRSRGWSAEDIKQRNQAQWPVARKMDSSTYVIWTEGTMDVLAEQLKRIFISPASKRVILT